MKKLSFFIQVVFFLLSNQIYAQTEVSGFIESNTIWTAANSPYFTSGNVIIEEGVTLTIEAGAVVKLSNINAIRVEGTIVAIGSASSPIVFTSIKDDEYGGDTNGDGNSSMASEEEWITITLKETSANSVFEHCIIKHGGQLSNGGITVEGSNPSITDCIFSENRVGLRTREGAAPIVDNNVFSNNILTPIQVSLSSSFGSFSGNTFADNQLNGIAIERETYDGNYTLEVPQLEGLENVPYIIHDNITIEPEGQLTIKEGVVAKVLSLHTINIEGTIRAEGTSSNPIVFTSIEDDEYGGDTNGDGDASIPSEEEWITITLKETSTNSVFEHCIIKHGGQLSNGGITVEGSNPSITDCIFAENRVGLRTREGAAPIVDNNVFSNNILTPIQVSLSSSFGSFSGNTFVDNQLNGIAIERETYDGNYTLEVPQLEGLENVPYIIHDNITIEPEGQLTIKEGVVAKVLSLHTINIEGTIRAEGTSSNPIVFTSIKDDDYGGDTNGDGDASISSEEEWITITLKETSTNSVFEHCIIKHGGQLSNGGITVEGSNPSITDCLFSENRVGLRTREGAAPIVDNNVFSNNILTPIQVSLSSSFGSFSGNTFVDNQLHGIAIERETYDGNYTLEVPQLEGLENVPYVIHDNITIEPEGQLTIKEGVVTKVLSLHTINIEGTLRAQGTISNPIIFTSIKDDKYGGDTNGDGNASVSSEDEWISLNFKETSTNSVLNHCIIKHGGQLSNAAVNVESNLQITNCTFTENKTALKKSGDFTLQIDSSLFCGNISAGISIEMGALEVNNSSFLNNSPYDIENLGTSDIEAEANWWNHSTYAAIVDVPLANLPNIYDGNDAPSNGIVKVSNPNKPVTDFRYDLNGFTVFFTNNTPEVEGFNWDFGDDTQSTQINPTHTYGDFGFYDVCLEPSDCDLNAKGGLCETVLVKGVSEMYPKVSGNSNTYIGLIKGAGFHPDDEVRLYKAGETDIIADTLIYIDSTLVKAFFTFENVSNGSWNLSVEGKFLDEQLLDALQIEETIPISLSTFVEGRNRIRTNTTTKLRLGVRNESNQMAFGVPLFISLSSGIEVTITNNVLSDTLTADLMQSVDNGFIRYLDDGDTTLVGQFLIPEILPLETFFLDIEILVETPSDSNNISLITGQPWFTSTDLIEAGVFYRSGRSITPPCANCILSIAEVLPGTGPVGCAAAFLKTSLDFIGSARDVIQGGSGSAAIVNTGIGYLSTAACFASAGLVPAGVIRNIAEGLNDISNGKSAAEAIISCSECRDGLELPTDFDFETGNSFDPNDKVGENGTGENHYIDGKNDFKYTIFFENFASATAPASEVFIADTIDVSTIDIESIRFTGFGFGLRNIDFNIPISDSTFTYDINLNPEKDIIVRVNGSVDYQQGIITWSLRSFDPLTMDLTEDIDLGFLPPNNNSPEGEGYVRFSISPKPSLPHLTEIRNNAAIVFDNNPAIITPIWSNTIDIEGPMSQVNPLSNEVNDTIFNITWTGDDNNESGIQYYDIYVSEDGENYEIWKFRTAETNGDFVGENNKTYYFYSIATDKVGNVEAPPAMEDASTSIVTGIKETFSSLGFKLYQNTPNPFNNSTKIDFEIPKASHVIVEVLNDFGRVEIIADKHYQAGKHTVIWQPNDERNNIYYYRITVGNYTRTKRMILAK